MKLGMLTYHFANNYGAAFQVYALQRVLKKHGIDAECMDFCSAVQQSNNSVFENFGTMKSIIKNIVRLPHISDRKQRIGRFADFRKKYMRITEQRFYDVSAAIEYAEKHYDAVLVGSDQVWNPHTDDFNSVYFQISRCKIPVFAYGASLGIAQPDVLRKYREDMLRFTKVSVREASAVDILKRIDHGIMAKPVLDPTLLLDKEDYEVVCHADCVPQGNYAFGYYLGRNGAEEFYRAAKTLAEKFNYKFINIHVNYDRTSFAEETRRNYGPEEFLTLLKNAKFVCTNSFHGVALSTKFKVPFYTFETIVHDNRKQDLLKAMHLEDRIVHKFDISGIKDYTIKNFAYEPYIKEAVEDSNAFIESLKNI